MFVTYIVFSKSRNEYFVGHSEDVVNRLMRHNNGKSKSTKRGIPWDLVWKYKCATRSKAVLLENKIKKRGIKRF
ncbi:MAG: GIY-YIG nuclease family protein [Bacteroidota bacterium]